MTAHRSPPSKTGNARRIEGTRKEPSPPKADRVSFRTEPSANCTCRTPRDALLEGTEHSERRGGLQSENFGLFSWLDPPPPQHLVPPPQLHPNIRHSPNYAQSPQFPASSRPPRHASSTTPTFLAAFPNSNHDIIRRYSPELVSLLLHPDKPPWPDTQTFRPTRRRTSPTEPPSRTGLPTTLKRPARAIGHRRKVGQTHCAHPRGSRHEPPRTRRISLAALPALIVNENRASWVAVPQRHNARFMSSSPAPKAKLRTSMPT